MCLLIYLYLYHPIMKRGHGKMAMFKRYTRPTIFGDFPWPYILHLWALNRYKNGIIMIQ